jgi:hypothetical protein
MTTKEMEDSLNFKEYGMTCALYNKNYEKINLNNKTLQKLLISYLYRKGFIDTSNKMICEPGTNTTLKIGCGSGRCAAVVEFPWGVCLVNKQGTVYASLKKENDYCRLRLSNPATSVLLRNGIVIVGHTNGTITFWNADDCMPLGTLSSGSNEPIYLGLSNEEQVCYHFGNPNQWAELNPQQWFALSEWSSNIKPKITAPGALALAQQYTKATKDQKGTERLDKAKFILSHFTDAGKRAIAMVVGVGTVAGTVFAGYKGIQAGLAYLTR